MQKDWANAPGFLGTFDQALAGIGISLEHAGLTGIDLDDCITDSGSFSPVAAEAIACGETYSEMSPSGEGVHFLARTSAVKTISGGRGNDGLIQRFGLMVWPDISPTWTNIDRKPVPEARDAAFRAFQTLDTLDWRVIGGKRDFGRTGDEEGLPYLRLSEEAHERFVTWRTELEKRLRQGSLDPMFESHLAKYRKLVPALALITHLTDGGTGDVSEAAVEKALRWAKYLETHAARTYASTSIAAADAARAIIAKVKSGHLKQQFGSREIVRAQWSMLRDSETIHAALQLLVDHDWLGSAKVTTPGRTATVYTVNPKVLMENEQGGAT